MVKKSNSKQEVKKSPDKDSDVGTMKIVIERDIALDFATKVYKKFDKLIKSIADVSQAEANKSTEIAKTNATMPKENKEKKSYGMLWLAVPIFLIVLIVILFRRMNNKEMDRFIKEHH